MDPKKVTGHQAGLPGGVTRQDVEQQLQRILRSPVFKRSERLTRFLSYSVKEGLNGGADKVHEYTIALEVFDKSADFDSRIDPVVRVEAGRLRAKIREYYATSGMHDELFVGIRDRGYLPLVQARVADKPYSKDAESKWNGKPCVAVLTFQDLSLRAAQGPFCEALTRGILHGLIKQRGLTVVSRSVSRRLHPDSEDFGDAARELAIDYIVEGSVQRHGDRVRILVEVSDAKTGHSHWSQSMDHPLDDILLLQEVVAGEVLQGLLRVLLGERDRGPAAEEREIAFSKGYADFVRGRRAWSSGAVKDLQAGIESFERAGRLDADLPAAWAGLANARIALALTRTIPPGSLMREAKTAAYRALAVDESWPEAHAAIGIVEALCEFDWKAAQATFERAQALAPTLPLIDQWHALGVLLPHGKIVEATTRIGHAHRAEPTSILLHYYLGVLHYLRGDYADAATILEVAVEIEPEYESAHLTLGDAYFFLGKEEEAMARYARVRELAVDSPSCWKSAEAFVHATNGRTAAAKRLLKRLLYPKGTGYSWPYEVAIACAALGEEETALEWLERAREDGVPTLAWLQYEPKFAGLRKHPKFAELVGRLGLRSRVGAKDPTAQSTRSRESR